MKTTLLVAIAISGTPLFSASFDPAQIAQDAKWVAHIDVDRFRESAVGTYLLTLAKSEMSRHQTVPVSLDVDAMFQEIRSITAYGTAFDDEPGNHSVLILKAGERARAIIDGFIAGQELSHDGKTPYKTLTDKAYPTHLIANEVYLSFPRKDLIMISKEFSQVERAMKVVEGRSPRLKKDSPVLHAPESPHFFFFASANGFNALKDMPPQARILQKTTGARVALGERRGDLLLNIALATNSAEVSNQLKRIVDGMLALASFGQFENQSLARLTQSVSVTESQNTVAINLGYPFEDLKSLIVSAIESRGRMAPTTRPSRPAPRAPAPQAEATDAIGGERLKVVNVDASGDDGNMARNANDNDMGTWWGAQGSGHWIRFELEKPSLVREVQLAWRKGNERRVGFTLQTSPDGRQWTDLFRIRTHKGTDQLESWNVTDTPTRWVRIVGPRDQPPLALTEARFLGQPGVVLPEVPQPEAVAAPGKN